MNLDDLKHAENFRDRISTVTKSGSRNWIYALKPEGKFYKFRNYSSYLYLLIFFSLPLIKIDGDPFFMLNFPEGKFIIYGKIFWPQDFFIFAVAMITFIIFIALFTVIYGRLFCGWACPQTIFMEMVFRKIEWWIEGSANQQRALNEKPWDLEKVTKKTVKHAIFLLISFLIANTFLSYIIGVDELYKIIREPVTEHLSLMSGLIIFTLLFYGVFAFVREIVCTTVCPYGRLQSVLFDKDTMQISYDYSRGEPRGKIVKGEERKLGDCIDCKKCVQVCPTGIDIRDGVQMECVGCTACIDVCNDVMEKLSFPKGLIRYASENEISKKHKFHFNNRMKAYTALLSALVIFMAILIVTRRSIDSSVMRAQGQLYQELDSTSISNLYTAKIINKTSRIKQVDLKLEEPKGRIQYIGHEELILKPESIHEVEFFVVFNKTDIVKRKNDIHLDVYHGEKRIQRISTNFLGPYK
jgi:cytochrome c oxidase accessory protein FixG